MSSTPNRARVITGYLAMLAATIGGYLLIHSSGVDLVAGHPGVERAAANKGLTTELLAHVLLALALSTLAARGMGILFQRFLKQPPVIADLAATNHSPGAEADIEASPGRATC